jgi:hypothetical protein
MPAGYWRQDMFFRSSLTLSEAKQCAFQIQLIKRTETVALGKQVQNLMLGLAVPEFGR